MRFAVFVVPIAVSFLVALVLSRWMDVPTGFWARVGRWILIAVIATAAMVASRKVMRRLLPLAALLSLTLVFPDETPSRFGVALRGMSARQLDKRLAEIDRDGLGETPREAATTLLELVAALSRHDRLTRGHSERVRAYAVMIGEEMNLPEEELDQLRWAALVHDVGKLAVPQEVLTKPGRLTEEEFAIIRRHPGAGRRLVEPLAGWLGPSALAVYEHHERWEGGGYPTGVPSSELQLTSRIVSVADAFDVMTSARSYKEPTSASAARIELERCAGTQFDPTVVRAMLNVSLGRLWRAMGPVSWVSQLGLFPRTVAAATPAANTAVAALVSVLATTLATATETTREEVRASLDEPPATTLLAESGDRSEGVVVGRGGAALGTVETVPPLGNARVPLQTTTTSPAVAQLPPIPTTPPNPARVTTTTIVVTLPPVVTTTTRPPTPTVVTTTTPATTTVTTTATTPAPTTSTLPPLGDGFVLASPGAGDQVSQTVLDVSAGTGVQNAMLPNYDTDRNDDPGLTLVASPNGLLPEVPEAVQAWRLPVTELTGTSVLRMWIAPHGPPNPGQMQARAGFVECDVERTSCEEIIGTTVKYMADDEAFVPVDFELELETPFVAEPGRHIEMWFVALNGSSNDVIIGYDSLETPSTLVLGS